MNYIEVEDFQSFYGIEGTEEKELIKQLISDAGYFFDFGTNLIIQENITWKQRMYGKNVVNLKNHINLFKNVKVKSLDSSYLYTLNENEYFIEGNIMTTTQKNYFIEITADIGYFTLSTIPEEIKSLIMGITRVFYEEYKKSVGSAQVSQKTIGRFSLSFFEKKIEKTGLVSIIDTIRSKYGIQKESTNDVKFFIL